MKLLLYYGCNDGSWDCPSPGPVVPSPIPPWKRPVENPRTNTIPGAGTIDLSYDTTYLNATVANTTAPATYASGVLTNNGNQPSVNDQIVIGANTYVFVNSFNQSIPNQVAIGGNASITFSNLLNAVLAGYGAGTAYSITTVANPQATVVNPGGSLAGASVTFTAIMAGAGGNSVTTVSGSSAYSFGAATLTGGITPAAAAYPVVLPNGNYPRQIIRIYIPGSNIPVSPASFQVAGTFAGFNTLTFNSVGFSAVLEWDSSAWQLIGGSAVQS